MRPTSISNLDAWRKSEGVNPQVQWIKDRSPAARVARRNRSVGCAIAPTQASCPASLISRDAFRPYTSEYSASHGRSCRHNKLTDAGVFRASLLCIPRGLVTCIARDGKSPRHLHWIPKKTAASLPRRSLEMLPAENRVSDFGSDVRPLRQQPPGQMIFAFR